MKLSLKTHKPLVLIWESCILSWCKQAIFTAKIEYNYSGVFLLNFIYCVYSIV